MIMKALLSGPDNSAFSVAAGFFIKITSNSNGNNAIAVYTLCHYNCHGIYLLHKEWGNND